MTLLLPARTPNDTVRPSSADAAAIQGKPGSECCSLPLAWEEPPVKPRAVTIRIMPPSGAPWVSGQPTAVRGFGINE